MHIRRTIRVDWDAGVCAQLSEVISFFASLETENIIIGPLNV